MTARPLADMTDADLRKLARHGPKVADSLLDDDGPAAGRDPGERAAGYLWGHILSSSARRELRVRKAEARKCGRKGA